MIARTTSPAHLGFISMKLDLLGNTVMALGRDGVRLALLRQGNDNGAWLTVPLTVLIGAICSAVSLKLFTEDPAVFPQFRQSVLLYYLAAVLESLCESRVVELIRSQRMREKIFIESTALVVRISVILVGVLRGKRRELADLIVIFSVGQIVYALSLIFLHFSFKSSKTNKFDFKLPSREFVNLAWSLTLQNIFKYFLAQGDLFIISALSSLKDQGVYAVVGNYGSLVLRMLMQPIEEASLQYFSRFKNGADYFNLMLKFLIYIGLLFICYGSFFTDVVISILLGKNWTGDSRAADSLSAYCYLVAAAGVSGFLECFVNAVIDEERMAWQRRISLISSVGYCAMAVVMIRRFGSVGLVTASAINFLLRATVNVFIIKKMKIEIFKCDFKTCLLSMFMTTFVINAFLFLIMRDNWRMRLTVAIVNLLISAKFIIKRDRTFVNQLIKHWS